MKAEPKNPMKIGDASKEKREGSTRQLVTKLRRRANTWYALPQLESVSRSCVKNDKLLNVKEKKVSDNISSDNLKKNNVKQNNVHVCDVCQQLHEIALYRPLPTECDKCWIKTFMRNSEYPVR